MTLRWRKMGLLFDPHDYELPNDCKEFAQSPQAVVLNDRVRIYFSTRQRDTANGKFVSHVAFVDMDKKLEKVMGVSRSTVIALGELGCFDEHGIFPFSPFQHEGKIVAYTCGWNRRQSVSVETATGYAVSNDEGLTFQKIGAGPILGPSLHEPFLVGDSFVRHYNGTYHMWYIYGVRWVAEFMGSPPDRVYKIAYASSQDGMSWKPKGGQIIADKLHGDECQALPTVIKMGGQYHMYFCYRDVFGFRNDPSKGYRLGYAVSDDLQTWTRDDGAGGMALSKDGWDSEMMCYPHIFEVEGRVYLLYNGNQFGRNGFGAAILEQS